MARRHWIAMTAASALVGGALLLTPARAQQGQSEQEQSAQGRSGQGQSPRGSGGRSGGGSAVDRVDQALKNYRDRLGQDIDETRQAIDRLREDMVELVRLRCDLELARAELQAEMGGGASPFATRPGFGGAGAGSGGDSLSDQERQENLGQQLRQAHDRLRQELNRFRGDTNRLISQVERLKQQQQRTQEQQQQREQGRQQPNQAQQPEQEQARDEADAQDEREQSQSEDDSGQSEDEDSDR